MLLCKLHRGTQILFETSENVLRPELSTDVPDSRVTTFLGCLVLLARLHKAEAQVNFALEAYSNKKIAEAIQKIRVAKDQYATRKSLSINALGLPRIVEKENKSLYASISNRRREIAQYECHWDKENTTIYFDPIPSSPPSAPTASLVVVKLIVTCDH